MLWTASFLVNYFTEYLNSYNAHFWSLCVGVQFYIAIALVILCFGRRGIWIVWPACLAITALRISDGAYIDIQTHLRLTQRRETTKIRALKLSLQSPHCGWAHRFRLRPYF